MEKHKRRTLSKVELVVFTPLEFVKDAISLSGQTGTKLKCEVVGKYYPFWWKITSGGKALNYQKPTAIVELYAATGEDYIKETGETILGSSGHALELKINHLNDSEVNTDSLKIVLIEQDNVCYNTLKRVIARRWPTVHVNEAEGPVESNTSRIYLLYKNLDAAIAALEEIELGNAIYYFDPLRNVEWKAIEDVAAKRIENFCQTGTEFMIFLFTSDWFLGRDTLSALPETANAAMWSSEQKKAIGEADALFGNTEWREHILVSLPLQEKETALVELYKFRLYKWFRYVLPMPFTPKENQLFHLILCSNYEAGVKVTKDFYDSITNNPVYLPGREPSREGYELFKKAHPEVSKGLSGVRRPLQWRILWKTIKYHEGGICDYRCRDFDEIEKDTIKVKSALEWLHEKGYLEVLRVENAWDSSIDRYRLCWKTIQNILKIAPPPMLKPISPNEFENLQWPKLAKLMEDRRGET
jgi:three-Cys-motif partner protein